MPKPQLKQVRSRCNELHDQCGTLAMYYMHVTQRLTSGLDVDETVTTLTAILDGINEDYSLEQHCAWVKELGEVELGETVLRAGSVPDAAIADDQSFFMSLHQRMQRTGERMVFYDRSRDVWLEPVRE